MNCPALKLTFLRNRAFSIMEITLVLGLLLAISGFTVFGAGYFAKINAARKAESVLRQVENARMSYLVDNPNQSYADVTLTVIKEYMADPEMLDKLDGFGYKLTDADVKAYPLTYGRDDDALAIIAFTGR